MKFTIRTLLSGLPFEWKFILQTATAVSFAASTNLSCYFVKHTIYHLIIYNYFNIENFRVIISLAFLGDYKGTYTEFIQKLNFHYALPCCNS